MKYIRTKDGIYEIIYEEETFYKCNGNIFVSKDIFYHKNRVADTIEELIDGYYVDVDNHFFTSSECYDSLEDAKKSYKDWVSYSDRKELEYEIIIYAFIKTNKGLIYVAKMNDKGELELL